MPSAGSTIESNRSRAFASTCSAAPPWTLTTFAPAIGSAAALVASAFALGGTAGHASFMGLQALMGSSE